MDLDPAANNGAVLFDAATLARLEGACQTVGSKEHVQAQAACASLDSAACAAYHDDCVKDHCAGWPTAVEAHADACRLNEELEEAHALHLPARQCGADTSVPPLASEQWQQQASQPRFESWRQKQAS